jgi:Cdc6-like AAA superfamily ATPase
MSIDLIEVEDSGVLKKQSFVPDKHLNIIKGANGSGKTLLLKGIVDKYKNTQKIRSLLASVQHFKSYPEIQRYANTSSIRPTICREFEEEYQTITQLTSNQDLIKDCNNFFKQLAIPTKLNVANAESGWLLFSNPHYKSKTTIPIDRISPGERTVFVLWLLTKNKIKPDVLILDEFDAHLSSFESILHDGEDVNIMKMMYMIIMNNFVNKGVQVFIATNDNMIPDLSNCGIDKKIFKYKKFKIDNGKIAEILH